MRQILAMGAVGGLAAVLVGCDLVGFKPLVPYVDTGPAASDSRPPGRDTGGESGESGESGETGGPVDADEDGYISEASGGDDCDDGDDAIHPGADEVCDGIDNDCDALIDDEDDDLDFVTATVWFADADRDGYGDPGVSQPSCTAPEGYVEDASDCDDSDGAINPSAAEVCDAADVDEDCDGWADELDPEGAVGASTWYPDGDGDGFGDALDAGSTFCEDPGSGWALDSGDCDDDPATGAGVNPAAVEACDGIDNDCDGTVDFAWAEDDFQAGIDGAVWTLSGDATTHTDAGDVSLQLTSGLSGNQSSTAIFSELFPASEPLYIRFTMEVRTGTGSPQAADGMTLFLAESDDVCLLGGGGGGLGIAGVADGYVFEFDLYDNGAGINGDRGTAPYAEYPHCALMENTAAGDLTELDYDTDYCGSGFLDVGEVFVEIFFDGGIYELWMDGVSVLSGDLGSYAPSTADLAIGFSGATGGAWAEQLVDDVYVQCVPTGASTAATCGG